MKRTKIAAALLCLSMPLVAQALEFQAVGNGALGVGGAGVARTIGAMSPYWNPAGLAFAEKTVSVSLTAGVGLEPGKKLAQDLDDLSKTYKDWDDSVNSNGFNNSIPQTTNLVASVNNISNSDNLRVTADSALGIQIKHFGTGVFGTFEGGASPNITPINPSSISNANDLKTALSASTVSPRGILLIEVPISYGYDLDLKEYGHLGLGITGKYLHGEVTSATSSIYNSSDNSTISSNDLTKQLSKNRNSKASVGIDLGVLWKPEKMVPVPMSVGLVGKNLNAPAFSTNSGDKIKVDPQIRAGLAISPLTWLDLVADLDVIQNTTVVPGAKSQQFGGGAEFKPFSSLKLRLGGYTDFAQSTGALTGGLSVGIPWVFLDIDGAYGLGRVKFDNKSYPSEAKLQFSMNFAF